MQFLIYVDKTDSIRYVTFFHVNAPPHKNETYLDRLCYFYSLCTTCHNMICSKDVNKHCTCLFE